MIYLKKSKNIFVNLLFSGSVNSNLYCGCCPCNKNDSTSCDRSEEKDKDKKQQEQNKSIINNLEGVVGLTCKLENNKICLYTKVPNNDNYKFAESTEEFKSEFKYEKFKDLRINIKIDEFGINWPSVATLKEQIEFLKANLLNTKNFKFLQNKIIFFTSSKKEIVEFLYDLSNMRIYRNMTKPQSKIDFLQNVDFSEPKNFKDKSYGITSNGKYYKQTGTGKGYDDSDENQAEYKKAFLEGK